jgi:plastocyanin
MNNPLAILKPVIGSILCGFLFFGCRSTPEKPMPAKHTIEIKAMKFQPTELVVKKGDTVVWVNQDIVAHDVTEAPGKAWASPIMASGASWSLVVEKSADYYCSIHVVMKGKLLMQ